MNRKLTLVVLALLMTVLLASSAFAAPSITVGTMTAPTQVTSSTGATIPADFFKAEISPEVTNEVAKISEALAAGESLQTYFSSIIGDIAALLPASFNLANLTINEVFSLKISDSIEYIADEFGDVTAHFVFATEYEDGQPIVVLVGIPDVDFEGNEIMEWIALEAEVVGGEVVVTFPASVLEQMGNAPVALAVLS